jgi:hypothetical protein
LLPQKEAHKEELFCVWAEENAFVNKIRLKSSGKAAESQTHASGGSG